MAITLITYGGGEILQNLFNSLAMLLNKDGGFLNPLMVIAISCGAFAAITKAFFSPNAEGFLLRFLFPLIAITSIVMLPSTHVKIEDVITNRSYKVDNVPWFLARTTELISTIGYRTTQAVETVMHVPNDLSYNTTGMIFGSETALDIGKYQITNAVLEQNLKRFANQCVFYDLALGKYNLNALKTTTDLWDFLKSNTSKVRMMPYTEPENPQAKTVLITCQKAVDAMTPIFEKEIHYYALQDIVKNLPFTFQALTHLKSEKEELISQQLMIHLLSGEFDSGGFAKSRAAAQQRSSYHLLGSLASSSLITMRAVMEALIYASILFILPLSVLPGGMRLLSNWLGMTLWIQVWPPFYAILNYVMQTIAGGRAEKIFANSEKGLSFFTSMGLMNLHEDIYAMSGYLAATIPFLSYALVKGGVSSIIHLASSMMAPAHSATASAAAEQASGNYHLASTSFGQSSFSNTTGFQKTLAPSIATGFFSENTGGLSTVYSQNEAIIRQPSSELRWGLSSDDSVISNIQSANQTAQHLSESTQATYMDSLSAHTRDMSDLTSHLSLSQNFSTSLSEKDAYGITESARYLQSQASSFSAHHGISERDSLSILLGTRQLTSGIAAGTSAIPLVGSFIGKICDALPAGSYDRHSTTDNMTSAALNTVSSDEFQKHFQNVHDFSQSHTHSSLTDEGMRLVGGITHSLDQVRNSQEQYQAAKSYSEQLSQTASWAEQNTSSIRKTLNQDLVNWGTTHYGFDETSRILTRGSDDEKSTLIGDFLISYRQQQEQNHLSKQHSLTDTFTGSSVPILHKEQEMDKLQAEAANHLSSFKQQGIGNQADALHTRMSQTSDTIGHSIHQMQNTLNSATQQMVNEFTAKNQKDFGSRLGSLIKIWETPGGNMLEKYTQDKLPLGWKQD